MPHRKICIALTPAQPDKAHLQLFERLGREFGFKLIPLRSVDRPERVKSLIRASFLIADLSGNDPGVLYDLGVAHTLGKRAFLVTDNLDTLAFDLASSRTWVITSSSEYDEIYQAMQQFLRMRQTIGPIRLFLGKYAFFGENLIHQRLGAFLIDLLLFLAVAFWVFPWGGQDTIVGRVNFVIGQLEARSFDLNEDYLIVAAYLMLAYLILSTWLLGASVGQLLTGVRVLQCDYRRVTFGQCVGRTALLYFVGIGTGGASFLWAARGPGYRAVHDILSGTVVVRRHPL